MGTKFRRFFIAALAVALLAATSTAVRPLRRMRAQYDLTNEPVKGLSPQLALATQVLGWARGIIIDVVWIRAAALEREKRYFELVQLADWACKLSPRVPEVWDYHGWNMAYNVSSQLDYLPSRWDWVKKGIELLRDEGIPQNPNSPELYWTLAWITWHKIGQQDDYAHVFYKERFALLMHEVLGGPGDREKLRQLAKAPGNVEKLLEDSEVRRLVERCREWDFDIAKHYFLWQDQPAKVPRKVRALLNKPASKEALKKVEIYARSKRLREELKLQPQRMVDLMDAYGPFDWRSPYPHSIYWATVGLEKLAEKESRLFGTVDRFGLPQPVAREWADKWFTDKEEVYDFERVQLERLIYGSLQNLVKHGRMLFDQKGRWLKEWGTDYRFADATVKFFERAMETWRDRYKKGVWRAYAAFLYSGVVEFHFMGDNEKSREYFQILKTKFPEFAMGKSYDEYLDWRIKDYTSSMTFSAMRRLVRGMITRAVLYTAAGLDEKAAVLEKKARLYSERWSQSDKRTLRGTVRYEQIKDSVLVDVLSGRYNLSEELLSNLKQRLGEEKVETVMKNIEKAQKEGRPEVEEVPEKYQVDPDLQTVK